MGCFRFPLLAASTTIKDSGPSSKCHDPDGPRATTGLYSSSCRHGRIAAASSAASPHRRSATPSPPPAQRPGAAVDASAGRGRMPRSSMMTAVHGTGPLNKRNPHAAERTELPVTLPLSQSKLRHGASHLPTIYIGQSKLSSL
eukprot:363053-Chlamydomonas_euryale.AAC.7